jgi:hypothetical protein
MEKLEIKNATLYHDKIVLVWWKKEIITINIEDILGLEYVKPSLLNYILSSHIFFGTYPGRLIIRLKHKIGKTKMYYVKIKYADFKKIPVEYKRLLL